MDAFEKNDPSAMSAVGSPSPAADFRLRAADVSEAALIQRCRSGDLKAFDELVHAYEKRVYNIAYRMLSNQDDALDAAQEVFIRIFTSLSSYRGDASFSTWVYRITVNTCLDLLKQAKRREVFLSDLSEEEQREVENIADGSADPTEKLERKEIRKMVRQAVARLPERFRVAIVLCDLEQLSYEEAAKVLGVPVGTLKSRLNRARLMLKNILKPMMEQ